MRRQNDVFDDDASEKDEASGGTWGTWLAAAVVALVGVGWASSVAAEATEGIVYVDDDSGELTYMAPGGEVHALGVTGGDSNIKAIGPAVHFDLDSNLEVPYVYDDGAGTVQLKMVDIASSGGGGSKVVLDDNALNNSKEFGRIAASDLNDNGHVDFVYPGTDGGVRRIDYERAKAGKEGEVVVPSSDADAWAMMGAYDIPIPTANGYVDVFWYSTSDKVKSYDMSHNYSVFEMGFGDKIERSNGAVGVGGVADFLNNDNYHFPYIGEDGDGDTTINTHSLDLGGVRWAEEDAYSCPVTAADIEGDRRKELVFIDEDDGEIQYIEPEDLWDDDPGNDNLSESDETGDTEEYEPNDNELEANERLGLATGSGCGQVIDELFNTSIRREGVISRTESVFTNDLDLSSSNAQGQFRFYSGSRIERGEKRWEGILIREFRRCGQAETKATGNLCDSDDYACFHEELGELINHDSDPEHSDDDRRVFTSAPHPTFFDYQTGLAKPHKNCTPYHSAYPPVQTEGTGQFGATYLDKATDADALEDRRIQFTTDALYKAMVDSTESPFDGAGNMYDYFGAVAPESGEDVPEEISECNSDHSLPKCDSIKRMREIVDEVRSQVPERDDKPMPGILNSDPEIAGPPAEGVPIPSYSDYRARFADRPNMLYQASHNGLLHAFYVGDPDVPSEGPEYQREAWAYFPSTLHDAVSDIDATDKETRTLMDGATTVQDARLCYRKEAYNNNYNACRMHCGASGESTDLDQYTCDADDTDASEASCVPDDMLWRTVAVQGLGEAGSGYFAVDVSRPGGEDPDDSGGGTEMEMPDPVPLWEFSPEWAFPQIQWMQTGGLDERVEGAEYQVAKNLIQKCRGWSDTSACPADAEDAGSTPEARGIGTSPSGNPCNKGLHCNTTATSDSGEGVNVCVDGSSQDPDWYACTAKTKVDGEMLTFNMVHKRKGSGGGSSKEIAFEFDHADCGSNIFDTTEGSEPYATDVYDNWQGSGEIDPPSMMGKSIGEAAIGTVLMPALESDDTARTIRRSVAVFTDGQGGDTIDYDEDDVDLEWPPRDTDIDGDGDDELSEGEFECEVDTDYGDVDWAAEGAIYVVDLQTGSLLRRFTRFRDPEGMVDDEDDNPKPFPNDITGSVTLFPSGPGKLATRGFVGDAEGRLFRIDFTGDDSSSITSPADWEVSLMFSPGADDQEPPDDFADDNPDPEDDEDEIAPVTAKPAVALSQDGTTSRIDNNLVVVYGLGQSGDAVLEDPEHAVFGIEEDQDARVANETGELLWMLDEDEGLQPPGDEDEKMIGKPKIFGGDVYFTTYQRNADNYCKQGFSRIWGFDFDEDAYPDLPEGAFNCDDVDIGCDKLGGNNGRVLRPESDTVIQGMTIAPPKSCQFNPSGTTATQFSGQSSSSGPQLVANTGGASAGTESGGVPAGGGVGADSDYINRAEVGLGKPSDQTIPMSWTVIDR